MSLFRKSKPRIPEICDTEGVIDWFLQYDDKIADFRRQFPGALDAVRSEILSDLAIYRDGPTLKAHISRIGNIWGELLEETAKRVKLGAPMPGEAPAEVASIFYTESLLAAEMRILGYFLLRRYGMEPE